MFCCWSVCLGVLKNGYFIVAKFEVNLSHQILPHKIDYSIGMAGIFNLTKGSLSLISYLCGRLLYPVLFICVCSRTSLNLVDLYGKNIKK